jgi:heme-degrading monooxygenase HmoA
MAFVALWEFRVRPGREAEFERIYGPQGDWARLFAGTPGFLGTELLRDLSDPRRFVTVDRWESRALYQAFREHSAAGYAQVDARCEELTASEAALGAFETP